MTILKSDRLDIGLKAKTEGPYKQSKKRVTHNQAALASHIRAAEGMRRKRAEVGRGRRGFAKVRRREEQLIYKRSRSRERDVWLPSLTTLSTADVPGDQMRELVWRRKEAGVPLKAVYMDENDDVMEEDMNWLQENLEIFDFFEGSDDE